MKAIAAALMLAQAMPADEAGLRMQTDEAERTLRTSPFIVADPALNEYVRALTCRLAGPDCGAIRVYVVRTPYLNASMAPNGAMIVWSGLFLRTANEAELAAVLAHEIAHYRARHSLRAFRDYRRKSDGWALLGLPVGLLTGNLGYSAAQVGLVASLSAYSREMEREADAASIGMLRGAGYDPRAASAIWAAVRAERLAAATARGRRPRGDGGLFASHPASAEREAVLAGLAGSGVGSDGAASYSRALGPHWRWLIEDQLRLNDPGGTRWLLDRMARSGGPADWIALGKGEMARAAGDLDGAVAAYRAALPLAEASRGMGLALIRKGDRAAGRAALSRYLAERPDAADAAMLRAMVAP
ncbi:M48 family metalloprotease [Sphingomonas sp. Y38-1Y]|uniref:M48 family metalloprotease n=1 Tax=Sphingomonas sp. Y38-1Y TaxID=3078265 RepID=UPI0028E95F48|nr:M48 family metalloprotease [Sphingomonas sp. Y38-1Y]